MNFGKIARAGLGFVKKHDSAILTGATIVSGLMAVYFAIKDTPKCEKALDELNEQGASKAEKAKVLLPLVGRTAMASAVMVGTAILNHKLTSDRISSLVSAYSIGQTIHEEYKKKVEDEVGVEKAEEIERKSFKDAYTAGKTLNRSDQSIISTGHGNDVFYDRWTGRRFYSDINYIKKVVNELNQRMMNEMFISLNDFYLENDLPVADCGRELGWSMDYGLIDIVFYAELDENDKPYTMLGFRNEPTLKYSRMGRW